MYTELWRRFGIAGDRARGADSRFVRYLAVLRLAQVGEGGEVDA